MNTVPRETALELCTQILRENAEKWYTLQAMQCWGCLSFSEDDYDRMCVLAPTGCPTVNARYEQIVANKNPTHRAA